MGIIFTWDSEIFVYYNINMESFVQTYINRTNMLNEEVEIIDESIEPFTKEEMEIYSNTPAYIEDLAHKVSLLIDVVNEMRKENERNKLSI